MKRREIEQRFDDIVEFSGVEKFIDTPVKRYSSGMYVRLAFAVAAHFEPEILLVDEVLAVGDAEFQRRCLGRMEDFGNSGRTVLFVSHNMQAVAQLCDRAHPARRGSPRSRRAERGDRRELPSQTAQAPAPSRTWSEDEAPGDDLVRLRSVRIVDDGGTTVDYVDVRRRVGIELGFTVLEGGGPPVVPKIKVHDRRPRSRSTRWTSTRGGTSRRRRATTSRPRGSPATCSTRASISVDAAVCSIDSPEAPPPRLGARGRVVPRAGPGGGRLLPRNVHRPVARRRPPAPRVDGQLSANRVGASSSSSAPVYV